MSLFVLGEYSEGIATGQRALGKLLAFEAALETESGWVPDFLFTIGLSESGRGEARSGVRLISAARRMYREDGIAEEVFTRSALRRSESGARTVLGNEDYETAARSGEAMSRDEAIELALSISPD
jgi:hypothetical protein